MRRLILAAIAVGIPVLWAFVPYGEKVGNFEYKTFGGEVLKWVREPPAEFRRPLGPEDAFALPAAILGAFGPLYPAVQAALLLFAPTWFAGRRRWVWFAEGVLLLLAASACRFAEDWSLTDFNWGATAPPRLFPPYWLLPGVAALAGLVALAIGIAPRSRFARFVLG
jgi:hypothetical protein